MSNQTILPVLTILTQFSCTFKLSFSSLQKSTCEILLFRVHFLNPFPITLKFYLSIFLCSHSVVCLNKCNLSLPLWSTIRSDIHLAFSPI